MELLTEMGQSSRERVLEARSRQPERELRARALDAPAPPALVLSPQGFDLIAEFKLRSPSMGDLSARTQERKEHAEVPSIEGLIITLEASLLYRLDPERASEVYQKIGPAYEDVMVTPNRRSVLRGVTSVR